MKRLTALFLIGTLLTGTADAASPRRESSVTGGEIRLGDLFDGLDAALADRRIGTAPAPGKKAWFDAPALARLAALHKLDWAPTGGADRVVVTRAGVELDATAIREALAAALTRSGAPAGLEVVLDNANLSLFLPVGTEPTLAVENLVYDPGRGRLTADLVAPADGSPVIRQSVGARAMDVLEIPVLSRRLLPGDVIGDADVQWLTVPRDRAGGDVVTDLEALIGQTVRRSLGPNQPVRSRDIRTPIVVSRGSLVTILLKTPTMSLTAQGRAVTDGGIGEVIRVTNTTSNRVIEATVSGPDLVTVMPPGQMSPARHLRSASN